MCKALLFSACIAAAAAVHAPTIQTSYGPINGITTASGFAYLGVPYSAVVPRWAPPRAPTPWTVPLNATAEGAGCPQFGPGGGGTEDCLVVNVFVPAVHSAGNPMIIYTHGGGFVGGTANGDFSSYANGTGAVVVSVEYRLGSLGYFTLPGMQPAYPTPTDPNAACANVGLLDQQAALQWAHANAAAFGADPTHVLITGQSAGGSSVLFQLTLPGAYSAYSAAWVQSPGSPVNTLAQGEAIASAIANKAGCPDTNGYDAQLACLRALPWQQFRDVALAVAGTGFLPVTLGPVVDGALVQEPHVVAMLRGHFNRGVPIVVSETLFEGDSLLTGFTHSNTLNTSTAAAALTQFGIMAGWPANVTAAVGQWYSGIAARDGYYNASSRMWGDGLISCASSWAAKGAAAYSNYPARRFLFNATLPQSGGAQPAGRSTHGTDLPFFFNAPSYFTPEEEQVQQDLYGWLVNLAVTGDVNSGPRGSGPLPWPAFEPGTDTIVAVNELHQYTALGSWQEDFCDAWLQVLP